MTDDATQMAEEYDSAAGRMLGDVPQALSDIALVNGGLEPRGRYRAPLRIGPDRTPRPRVP